MIKDKDKNRLIEELKKTPVVQLVCQRMGVGRTTYYRWYKEDAEFRKAVDEAMAEGESLINDMGESILISLMKEKNWNALRFWLEKRHPKYVNRLIIKGNIDVKNELSAEQQEAIKKALFLMSMEQMKNDEEE